MAALQLGCPGAQVRPEPGDCPAKAVDAMFNRAREDGLRLEHRDRFNVVVDKQQPGEGSDKGIYNDGPVTGVVRRSTKPESFPDGTLLSGYLWTGGEFFVGRYTEAHLPDGRTLPVCIELGKRGYGEKADGSKPGAVVFDRDFPGYAVERWH
ncbi:MAG: hypothetical protein EOO71_13880 [Myxococcaceae bacterium]|nr:MAG: hypothetical protein EOO71_13880 [Myxococcaceae bacterium]